MGWQAPPTIRIERSGRTGSPITRRTTGSWFLTTSGATFTRTVRFRLPQGNRTLFAEPRGSQRFDPQRRIDVKVEKQFRLHGDGRLGFTVEGFSILNESTITDRTTRSGASYF